MVPSFEVRCMDRKEYAGYEIILASVLRGSPYSSLEEANKICLHAKIQRDDQEKRDQYRSRTTREDRDSGFSFRPRYSRSDDDRYGGRFN